MDKEQELKTRIDTLEKLLVYVTGSRNKYAVDVYGDISYYIREYKKELSKLGPSATVSSTANVTYSINGNNTSKSSS